ncbi:MAG: hypothetical protein WCF90_08505 [Methanomicrobiales archaeon]
MKKTDGYVGADIESVVREVKMTAVREFIPLMSTRSEPER